MIQSICTIRANKNNCLHLYTHANVGNQSPKQICGNHWIIKVLIVIDIIKYQEISTNITYFNCSWLKATTSAGRYRFFIPLVMAKFIHDMNA